MSGTTKAIIIILLSLEALFYALLYNGELAIIINFLSIILAIIIVITCYELLYDKILRKIKIYKFTLNIMKPLTIGVLMIFVIIGVITCYDLIYYRFIEKSFVYKDTRFIESVGNYIKKEGHFKYSQDTPLGERFPYNKTFIIFRNPAYCGVRDECYYHAKEELPSYGNSMENTCGKTIKLESIYYTSNDNKKGEVIGTYIGQVEDFTCKYTINTKEKFSRGSIYSEYYSGN